MQVTRFTFPDFAKASFDYTLGCAIPIALDYDGPVVCAIDPSKTAMGITIGSPSGEMIEFFRLSGKNMDTTEFCHEFKEFLLRYIPPSRIIKVVYEMVIKRDDEQSSYISMVVLNEIQSHIIEMMYSMDSNKNRLRGVNNWAWKAGVLPDEFRKKGSGKGSLKYLCSLNRKFSICDDNITDSACIYIYYVSKFVDFTDVLPTREESNKNVKICICTEDTLPETYKTFQYNPEISVYGNASYVKNRIAGMCVCPISNELSIRDIYQVDANVGLKDSFYLAVF